jgi:hypothetical protein
VTVLSSLALILSAGATLRAGEAKVPQPGNARPLEYLGLHNVFRLSEKLYTGSVPEGRKGFRTLQRLGIRSVISVDGAVPDVQGARRSGMRYVHLPFGYGGCPRPTADRISRAVRDLPGPVYLHCHHGKHRAPTAAAFARIAVDGLSPAAAVAEMERAGTGKEYLGLYAGVRSYRAPTGKQLDRVPPDFPETFPAPPVMRAMVEIQERFDRLMEFQKEAVHRTESPDHEALLLREAYTELLRRPEVRKRPPAFAKWMRSGEQEALALEKALAAGDRDAAGAALGRLAVGCKSCHATYRDVPQAR